VYSTQTSKDPVKKQQQSKDYDCNAKISTAQHLVETKLNPVAVIETTSQSSAMTKLPQLYLSHQDSIQTYTEFDETMSGYLINSITEDLETLLIPTTDKRVQLSKPAPATTTTNLEPPKSINSYTKINSSMTNMTKAKQSLFKRLSLVNSDFFGYNNFISNFIRKRRNFDKLKNMPPPSAAAAAAATPNVAEHSLVEPALVVVVSNNQVIAEVTSVVSESEDLIVRLEELSDDYVDIDEEISVVKTKKSKKLIQSKRKSLMKFGKKSSKIRDKSKYALALGLTGDGLGTASNQFTLHNKPPIWNETSQVYQLDFGGRVTQESAKNFQIEYAGKQVMQFGRIDSNAYTLDFEWPFTTVQAFSIALANITQRLK
jgi:hypothetical protein